MTRNEAIGILKAEADFLYKDDNPYYRQAFDMAIEALQQEPKTGEWIMHIDDLFPEESTMECNQCHEHQTLTIDDNFCPNCGADMRGDTE